MKVHFKFYRRNRLLLVVGLIFLAMTLLTMLPMMYTMSANTDFAILNSLYSDLNRFSFVFTAGLGLFLVSSHLKDRNIKMVLTKPCLPETWLLSGILSAVVVSFVLYLSIFVFALIFSLVMGIPFQAGFIFISINGFMRAVVLLSYIVFLAMIMHPVVVVMVALIFNEGTVEQLKFMVTVITRAFGHSRPMGLFNNVIDALYIVLPITRPISENYNKISASMIVSSHDWVSLLQMVGYTAATAALFFFLSDYFLRRKQLI